MDDLLTLLSVYYHCTALAEAHQLDQTHRFPCNETYQQAKRLFLEGPLAQPGSTLTQEQNTRAYLLFKSWEAENADLVRALKSGD
jgi:hypothetical protein